MRLDNRIMFDHVINHGKTFKSKGVVLIAASVPQDSPEFSRIGFIVRKSSGKAVTRNKIRRTLRIVFQESLSKMSSAKWMVFNIPKGPLQISLKTLRKSAKELLLQI